jgi:hypothetical protein
MFKPIHNKKFFCKYVAADVAIKILSELKVKWSSPLLFNDPFDTQQDFNPDDEDILKILFEKHKNLIYQEREPDYTKMDYLYATKIKLLRSNRKKLKPEELLEAMRKDKDKTILNFRNWLGKLNKAWQDCCADDRIFCVVEDYDNLLMWSHYADCHKGAVIKLRCIPELDTPLCAATPIIYSDRMPVLAIIEDTFYDIPADQLGLVQKLFYVKSNDWSYEKEWRVVLKRTSDNSQNYDMNNIHKEEIEAIYLGCKMSDRAKDNILEIVNTKMQHVTVFQACKNRRYFKLDFIQIK